MSLAVVITVLGAVSIAAKDSGEASVDDGFSGMHQAGVRLGVWVNTGETPPATDTLGTFETSFKDATVYFEAFFAYRLARPLMVEVSGGIVNRGSVTFVEANATNIGNVLLYPLLVQLKVYPLASLNTKLQPYLAAGGGLYYGRRTVQFTTSQDVPFLGLREQSGTDFNYVMGGGIDWPVGETIGLEASVKYMPIEFSKGLQTIRDYDAIAFAIGVKYLYSSKRDK